MFKDYEILTDTDIKNLETKVKKKLSTWQPIANIVVIPHNKSYNEFSLLMAELDPQETMFNPMLDYQIVIENDLKRLETQIKRAGTNGFIPIENFVLIENFHGYNQFAIQLAKIDTGTDPGDIYGHMGIP